MNVVYLIGIALAIFFTLFGISFDATAANPINLLKVNNFVDVSSILIVVGGTLAVVIACYPKLAKSFPKHMKIMLRAKLLTPLLMWTSWWSWPRLPERTDCCPWRRRPMNSLILFQAGDHDDRGRL